MKKICYVGYPPTRFGSPDQSMAMEYISKTADCHIDYFCMGNSYDVIFSCPKRFTFYCMKKSLASVFVFITTLITAFFRKQYDFVYVQGAQQTPLVCWLPLFAYFRKCKMIYHTQDYLERGSLKIRFYVFFERFFARRADIVVMNESNRARYMTSNYNLKTMPIIIRTTLPSYFEIPDFSLKVRNKILYDAGVEPSAKSWRIICAGGSYSKNRMSPQLVDAFYKLPTNYILVFTAMHNDSQIIYNKHITKINKSERIVNYDSLPFADMLSVMTACDIGILLYPNSGVGNYYQCPGRFGQYLRCGLKLITSDFPGLELLVVKYQLGAVANPFDSGIIAEAIQKIGNVSEIELQNERSRMIELGKTIFAYETDGKKLLEILYLNQIEQNEVCKE